MNKQPPLSRSKIPPNLMVGVVCHNPRDHQYLNQIRRWWAQTQQSNLFADLSLRVELADSTDGAFNRLHAFPGARFLVAEGVQKSEILNDRNNELRRSLEAIIFVSRSPAGGRQSVHGNLDFFEVNDPVTALRTAVLRYLTKTHIRVVTRQKEYEEYFRLRYRVWKEAGYLTASAANARSRMELDFTDRTAVPVAYFTEDGTMAACARLVRELGEEDDERVSIIEKIILDQGDPVLTQNFKYPEKLSHPFDILEAFPGFRKYYRQLVLQRISKAEVSRVIVDKGHRRNGIAEALVDYLVGIARSNRISVLLLACPANISRFYKRVGFEPVEGLAADNFLHIQVPSIVMERHL